MATATEKHKPPLPLHSHRFLRRRYFNRAFAAIYILSFLALLYHHTLALSKETKTLVSISVSICLLIADLFLFFMWSTTQCFRMNPLVRKVFPENLEKVVSRESFPALDIFICTADPYKEPPLTVINTALSVMAYDYPTQKISVYVSDDGGSQLTLFAFLEAAKFGRHWLPFCRENSIMERCPDAYFSSNYSANSKTQHIKMMYEKMKLRVESAAAKGEIADEYISSEQERTAFSKWTPGFTRHQHPSVVQVLLDSRQDRDITGDSMPNLIYLSREKSKTSPHHFKGGALNALLRVSAVLTNAPVILTLDCDMFSNDPHTVQRVLCLFMDHSVRPNLGYIQLPQIFNGLNKADIYGCEFKPLFQMNPRGMDGQKGPNYYGTGCFFLRRALFGGPSSRVQPEIPELSPDQVVKAPITSAKNLTLANLVAGCNYENHTNWGSKIGFKYGSLVEDYYTGYRLVCEGWQSAFCDPERPAFLGDIPISLNDALSQTKRWSVGLLEVAFSKFSPITFGVQAVGFLEAHCFGHYAFWPVWSVPVAIYAFLPQLSLLNNMPIFPKASDPWFYLYAFLFLGAYIQECLDFILAKSTFERWWNEQRMWLIRGLTSYLFGTIEFFSKLVGIPTQGFNVTSKVVDDEQGKRYGQGIFEFGVPSPMFLLLSVAAIINLIAFLGGFLEVLRGGNLDGLFVQLFIAGFAVLNSMPLYEAMVLRADKGKMPTKTTIISAFIALGLCVMGSFMLRT
ncbi:cellulose synthase-like protein G3 [Coffea arabica]|uniref:Cellulose synthase-like protein G3 n=1 Tax=Coffea arabica TaxID=13443 RepID=A0ABM4VFU6_COFAR